MRVFKSRLGLLLLALGVVYVACRKTDYANQSTDINKPDLTSQFFAAKPGTERTTYLVLQEIQKRNKISGFVNKFAHECGLPVWDKAIGIKIPGASNLLNNNSTDTIVYIPLVLQGQSFVNGYIKAEINDSIVLSHALASDYVNLPFNNTVNSADHFAAWMMYLNKEVFGEKEYRIIDKRLFNDPNFTDTAHEKRRVKIDSSNTNSLFALICFTHTTSSVRYNMHCTNTGACSGGSCDWCGLCVTPYFVTITNQNCSYESMGGGTGNSGPWNPGPTGGTGGGPIGWLSWEDPPVDPNVYDTIRVSDVIRDSFPCLYDLLKNDILNPNFVAQTQLLNVFYAPQYVNLKFDVDWTMNITDDNARERLDSAGNIFDEDLDSLRFSTTIYFNPHYLRNATKEAVVSTVFHESIHAYIKYMFSQYMRGLVSEAYLRSHFPMHWSWYNNTPPANSAQHIQMGNAYIGTLDSLTRPFYNPAAPASIRNEVCRALAWRGLHKATGWPSHPDTCRAKAIVLSAESAQNSLINLLQPAGCGTYDLPYTDSLKLSAPCH